ncbi:MULTISPECIES: hypothetical protein [Streptomyces]|uniref:hypothetical protein n=1 Tax=Streptomyces TaxID=1883 RepID=UPI001F23268A|nr:MULTISPECIES: hypothetical protein [Streptomyces]MCL6670510.1 hypothetical protein [Streptomyces panaciradicis]
MVAAADGDVVCQACLKKPGDCGGACGLCQRIDEFSAAIHQWLVVTGRIDPAAHITHLEIRTWRPR